MVLGARQRDAELDLDVAPRSGEPHAELPPGVEPTQAWHEHVRAAHADGYAVVAGSIDWRGGLLHPRPKALAPYAPGVGRVPQFGAPLLCPSVLPGVELTRLAGRRRPSRLRRAAGRAVDLRRPGRAHSSTAIRSSTDLKTSAPTTSATIAATTV